VIDGPAHRSRRWAAGPPVPTVLGDVLDASRRRGLIGSTDNEEAVAHSRGFADCISLGSRVLDLGSGGGLPGLVLAVGRPDLELVLLDSAARRTRFLEASVRQLGLSERVSVLNLRAEEAGRDERFRGRFDVVVSRSFGAPAVAAECARPFMADGGLLVVSEPPTGVTRAECEVMVETSAAPADHDRWPPQGLEALGFSTVGFVRRGAYGFVVLEAVGACPERFPRRPGVPSRKPLF
jgi:16S rRNA (guanine527-N7)-methyltransferase